MPITFIEAQNEYVNTLVQCFECDRERPISATDIYQIYGTPWDTVGTTEYLCNDQFGHAEIERQNKRDVPKYWKCYESCSEVLKDNTWADFHYFDCVECNRTICEQNPKNGWEVQYRIIDCEQVCIRCYKVELLKHGISRESVKNGELSGIFFDINDLDTWEKIIDCLHIDNSKTKKQILDNILAWIDKGYKAVINYERLSITGTEGYISVYRKKIDGLKSAWDKK